MVNLEWYRTFKAIYKTGTLTEAADTLFISQPGVSLHLSSLEAYVGYKLFDRTGRRMIPTERGKVLYNAITEPWQNWKRWRKTFRNRRRNSRQPSVSACVLKPFRQHWSSTFQSAIQSDHQFRRIPRNARSIR
jgi:DNA-binding transcriptional LysR family regulator